MNESKTQLKRNRGTPIAFISSTSEDLKAYRDAARDGAIGARFHPEMMEYFEASGRNPPLQECLARVWEADVLVVIVAYRYGWVPPNQPDGQSKNITWLECEHAAKQGKEVLAFLVDKDVDWPDKLKEEYRLAAAVREGQYSPNLAEEVARNVANLREFRSWLETRGIRVTFTSTEDLRGRVESALREWRTRHAAFSETSAIGSVCLHDPQKYLEYLRKQTSHIDIRGLKVGRGEAMRFHLKELYIRLTATLIDERPHPKSSDRSRSPEDTGPSQIDLRDALNHRRLAIVGDPGSGKTTFLRYLAFLMCTTQLDKNTELLQQQWVSGKRFPILIRLVDLWHHMQVASARSTGPIGMDEPLWLSHYLGIRCEDADMSLDEEFFRTQLQLESTSLLLDGLDEAPSVHAREQLARLIENASCLYEKCHFVITSRPVAFGQVAFPGFVQARISDLESDAVDSFVSRWCQLLFSDSSIEAKNYHMALLAALRNSAPIRRLARNPVMLTALAVIHWHEKHLPEQRADLYQSIIDWLAKSRKSRPGRSSPERSLGLLQSLALAMQNQPSGRCAQVTRYWAAKAISPCWRELPEVERVEMAEAFLREEEDDSGIVVSRGDDIRFWHLTFQEYLAARALAARDEQRQALCEQGTFFRWDWREVAMLLAGVLYQQGIERMDQMVSVMLNQLRENSSLAERARCVGLLGAMVSDLSPFRYCPGDERYKHTLDSVLGIFDANRSASVPFDIALEAAEALGQAGDPRLGKENHNWIAIEAGEFWMGSQREDPSKANYDPDSLANESHVHPVYLDAYQIGRYPVTVAEYRRFLEDEGYETKCWWESGGFGEQQTPGHWDEQLLHPNRPVVEVTWYEAAAYGAWAGARLPTSAEWERSARGTEGRKYPWGDGKPNSLTGNYDARVSHATPVGLYPMGGTPEGILDLGGNVWEWVSDWHREYYLISPAINPKGPERGLVRVLRGGGWNTESRHVRAAEVLGNRPDLRRPTDGFRCAKGVLRDTSSS
jgi:formylglycine-generating enzyme required for sulfatase activity